MVKEIAKNNTPGNRPFCGLHPLISRLKEIATAGNWQAFDEIYDAVEELQRLDNALVRLRCERSYVDEADIDLFIDRLRCVSQRGEK